MISTNQTDRDALLGATNLLGCFDYTDSFEPYGSGIQRDSEISKPLSETETKRSLTKSMFFEPLKNNQPDSIEGMIEHTNRLGYSSCSERISVMISTNQTDRDALFGTTKLLDHFDDSKLLGATKLLGCFDYTDSFEHHGSGIQRDSEASKPLSETEAKRSLTKSMFFEPLKNNQSDFIFGIIGCLLYGIFFEPLKNNQPDSIEGIVEHINCLGYPGCSERISFLNNTDDLEEGELPLCLESAKGFLLFFTQFYDVLGEPVLGLFPEGTLSVGWRLTENKHLLVEPLDSQNASFALIRPSNDNPDGKFRLNGRGKIAEVIDTLKRQGIDQWRSS